MYILPHDLRLLLLLIGITAKIRSWIRVGFLHLVLIFLQFIKL